MMRIALETSLGKPIDNYQGSEISSFELDWSKEIVKNFPLIKPRTNLSPKYNCHGLTFASRRTKILKSKCIWDIISDDHYEEVLYKELCAGDIVIYFSETGDINHSGIVVEGIKNSVLPFICSKWGNAGEFIHSLKDIPSIYGPNTKFYRCRL